MRFAPTTAALFAAFSEHEVASKTPEKFGIQGAAGVLNGEVGEVADRDAHVPSGSRGALPAPISRTRFVSSSSSRSVSLAAAMARISTTAGGCRAR